MTTKPVLKHLPVFKFANFSSHRHPHYRCVVADAKVFHRVHDVTVFYKTFGYTDEVAGSGVAPDEYIWDSFTRSDAPQSRECLQRLVVHYLQQHSREFKEQYGDVSQTLAGQCVAETITTERFCTNCFMHPGKLK